MRTSKLSPAVKCRDVAPPAIDALLGAGLSPTVIRFAGHLPYFKVGSGLMLSQELSLTGVVLMTLTYSILCLAASRWTGGRKSPFVGTLGLLAAMMLVGPVIAGFFSVAPLGPDSYAGQLLPMLGLLLPVCSGFLAVQTLILPARPTKG